MANNAQKLVKTIQAFDLKKFTDGKQKYKDSISRIPQTDPWAAITLKGQGFKVEYSFQAVREFYRVSGKDISKGELRLEDLGDMDMLVQVLLCGLMTHQPDMTEETLLPLLTMKHRLYYAQVIVSAIEATQPDYDQLEAMVGDLQLLTASLEAGAEAGDTTAPLPEIVPSPISGQLADNS